MEYENRQEWINKIRKTISCILSPINKSQPKPRVQSVFQFFQSTPSVTLWDITCYGNILYTWIILQNSWFEHNYTEPFTQSCSFVNKINTLLFLPLRIWLKQQKQSISSDFNIYTSSCPLLHDGKYMTLRQVMWWLVSILASSLFLVVEKNLNHGRVLKSPGPVQCP